MTEAAAWACTAVLCVVAVATMGVVLRGERRQRSVSSKEAGPLVPFADPFAPPRPTTVEDAWANAVRAEQISDSVTSEAGVVMLQVIDRLVGANALESVNALLRDAEVWRVPHNVLLAILNATWPARERLSERPGFVERAQAALAEALGAERAERLTANRR